MEEMIMTKQRMEQKKGGIFFSFVSLTKLGAWMGAQGALAAEHHRGQRAKVTRTGVDSGQPQLAYGR